jgi:hypothetical protein
MAVASLVVVLLAFYSVSLAQTTPGFPNGVDVDGLASEVADIVANPDVANARDTGFNTINDILSSSESQVNPCRVLSGFFVFVMVAK